APGTPAPFRVLIDGQPPGTAQGADVDGQGYGTAPQQRLYQLIRQRGPIADHTFEITFPDPGGSAYAFTFGYGCGTGSPGAGASSPSAGAPHSERRQGIRGRACPRILGDVIRAVVFDLDGVLLDSERLWDQARREVAIQHHGRWPADATAAMLG